MWIALSDGFVSSNQDPPCVNHIDREKMTVIVGGVRKKAKFDAITGAPMVYDVIQVEQVGSFVPTIQEFDKRPRDVPPKGFHGDEEVDYVEDAESEDESEVAVNTKADSQKKAPGRGRLPKNGKYIPELDEIRHIHDNTLWNKTLKKFE